MYNNEEIALKIYDLTDKKNKKIKLFLNEVEILMKLKSLNYPNIIKYYGATIINNNTLGIIFEKADISLKEYILI